MVYDSNSEEPEPKKAPGRKPISGKKKQPALIARALETQEKIEKGKGTAASEPQPLEERASKPKREKVD